MSISNNFRTIYEDGNNEYVFSCKALKKHISHACTESKRLGSSKSQGTIMTEIAGVVNKSPEAVKQWVKGYNGPSDIDVVRDLASYLNIDFMELLVLKGPTRKESTEFIVSGNDEKSIVIELHAILAEFIYNYIGSEMRDAYIVRHYGIGSEVFDDEISDYILNVYKQLEKNALKISSDTYRKLHRFITECKVFATIGTFEGHPYMSTLVKDNPRWIKINPHLKYVADYSAYGDFDYALCYTPKKEMDELVRDFKEEANCEYIGMGYDYIREEMDSSISEQSAQNELISDDDYQDYYYHQPYEAVPMELAKTLTMLFREDFPKYFNT